MVDDPGLSRDKTTETGNRQLEEAGYDLIQVLLERSHKNGMQFLGGMRMNDRHGISKRSPFLKAHPEWRMKSLPAVDYKHEGLRKAVLDVAEEFLQRYDVDGLELDWMRWCHMFNPSEAVKNTPILTDFTVEMRKLLDQAAKKRGRDKLLLGVRVPATMEECRILGFDVKAWVRQGLVDYLCPSDFIFLDLNIRTDEFTALTKGTPCKVYPSVHPEYRNYSLLPQKKRLLSATENYRAAAKNFYAHGADGVSAYNYMYHWWEKYTPDIPVEDEWPETLGYLTGLRDPESVAQGDRHYLYYPQYGRGVASTVPTGMIKRYKIALHRKDRDPTGSLGLLMAEDLKEAHLSATLRFKVTNLAEDDEIEVQWNGQSIPTDRIKREHRADGRPAFYSYSMPLTSPPAKFGDNEIGLRLKVGADTKSGDVVAQEFEVLVRDSRDR